MTANELAKKISHWLGGYGFCGEVVTENVPNSYVVQFEARTTKSRASSMVTRVGLIASEVLGSCRFEVGKSRMGEPPLSREALSTWKIFVEVKKKGKL